MKCTVYNIDANKNVNTSRKLEGIMCAKPERIVCINRSIKSNNTSGS
jgi:hypothetical protein